MIYHWHDLGIALERCTVDADTGECVNECSNEREGVVCESCTLTTTLYHTMIVGGRQEGWCCGCYADMFEQETIGT